MNRLRKLRNYKGLTLKKLSILTGISINSLQLYETEKVQPTAFMLEVLSDFYKVSIDYLLCRENKYKEIKYLED